MKNNKLMVELMNDIANGSVKLSDDSALYQLINRKIDDYLKLFSNKIQLSVSNLSYISDKDIDKISQLYRAEYNGIIKLGKTELKQLLSRIDQNLSPQQVNNVVRSSIATHAARATNNSASQIKAYFSALNKNTDKVNKLSNQVDKLSIRLKRADEKANEINHRFWYGIATTVITTACVCWILL